VFPLLDSVAACATDDISSAAGVNDRADLMAIEEVAQARIIDTHARAGVTFRSPGTVVVDASVEIGEDTVIEAGVTLKGVTKVGSDVTIANAYVVDAEVGDGATIGPFAYLRPGTVIGENAKIGTFVETKNANIGAREGASPLIPRRCRGRRGGERRRRQHHRQLRRIHQEQDEDRKTRKDRGEHVVHRSRHRR
jgi:bifunctional N-acetylglucosamine-1-phosphate-uridyltransferase/glucosamine-1-phosphate-acetyltransferase GlmU-like protein